MFLLYADEFGHDGLWNPVDPKHNHHPIFGLAGIAIPASRAMDLDRGFFRLKQSYYKVEIAREFAAKGTRPERFEWKELANRRDFRFTVDVLRLIQRLGGAIIANGLLKRVGDKGYRSDAIYGSTAQGLMRAFEKFLRECCSASSRGVIVMDRRTESRDVEVSASAQSHLFSARSIGGFSRLVEIPFLVRSEWHHGVQAADTVARVIGKVYRYRALNERRLKRFDDKFSEPLDSVTARSGNWVSVFVRGVSQPPKVIPQTATPTPASANG